MKTLKQYMSENKITCRELAEFIGCSECSVRSWRSGRERPNPNFWKALVELFGITESIEALFPRQARHRRWGQYELRSDASWQKEYNILAEVCADSGINNERLSKKLGVSCNKVYRLLHGRCSIPQRCADVIASMLQLDVADLYALWSRTNAAYRLYMREYLRRNRDKKEKPQKVQKKDIESLPVSLPKPPPPKTGVFVLIIKADNSYFAAGEWMTVKVFKTRRNALVFAKDHMAKWVVDDNSIYQPVYETLEKRGAARFNAVSYCIYENTVD